MAFIQTATLKIHYECVGAGHIPLLFVHGNFATWRWWRPVLEQLPPIYQAYALDLRGCGDTDRPADGYSIEQLTLDLEAFVTSLNLTRFHLIGHSLGGAVALQFALQQPAQVKSLMLVAPAPAEGLAAIKRGSRNGSNLLNLLDLKRDASLDVLETTYRYWQSLEANRPLLRRALKRMMPTLPAESPFQVLVDDAARMPPEAVVGFLQSLDTWNVQAELNRLQMPTLILWGRLDRLIPLEALQRMRAALPRGYLTIWDDVGHSPQLEQPERFTALLNDFVQQHPGWQRDLNHAIINPIRNRVDQVINFLRSRYH